MGLIEIVQHCNHVSLSSQAVWKFDTNRPLIRHGQGQSQFSLTQRLTEPLNMLALTGSFYRRPFALPPRRCLKSDF